MVEPARSSIDRDPRAIKSDAQRESAALPAIDPEDRLPPIDFDHLRRYTLGDARLECEVLELFCSHAPMLIAELRRAGSDRSWRETAHSLKGSARAIGAWEIARTAELAELAAVPRHERAKLVSRLESAVRRVQRFTMARRAIS